MSGPDGVKITCEMQIDIFHRHHLCIATTGSPALHPKARPKRWLTQAYHGLFTNSVKTVAKPNCGGCFAFAGRCRRHCRHQDKLSIGPVVQGGNMLQADFCLGMAIGLNGLRRQT